MKKTISIIIIIILVVVGIYFINSNGKSDVATNQATNVSPQVTNPGSQIQPSPVQVVPISHATAVLTWSGKTFYTDPVGSTTAFSGKPAANIILVTDIHPDHLNASTLNAVIGSSTLIVPQAVKDLLPKNLASRAKVMKNGDVITEQGFKIEAVPMYNLPVATSSPHTKGRGNGYIVEKDGYRMYIAGDTSGTPEMRALKNINLAFIPMNLPYTMSVEEAADAVLAFKPALVFPYHYRGQNGLSDVNKFKQLVNAGNQNIQVVLANWYPQQ